MNTNILIDIVNTKKKKWKYWYIKYYYKIEEITLK